MCYSGQCQYEKRSGDCGLPYNRTCPDEFEERRQEEEEMQEQDSED